MTKKLNNNNAYLHLRHLSAVTRREFAKRFSSTCKKTRMDIMTIPKSVRISTMSSV